MTVGATVLAGLGAPMAGATPPEGSPSEASQAGGRDPAEVAALWTPAARAAAIPRDLVIDERGLGYLKRADGSLEPYGHGTSAITSQPQAVAVPMPSGGKPNKGRPGGGGTSDTTPPIISALAPDGGATVGSPASLSATVTDDVSVRSATIFVSYMDGAFSSFAASQSGTTWGVGLSFNVDGAFTWYMVASDSSGNSATSDMASFKVDRGGGTGGTPDGVIVNDPWNGGESIQEAAGRIYFYMPSNRRQNRWTGYVCSGTAVTDGTSGRSVILTAAHCVYDDVNKAFAKDVMFIPNQAATGTRTDRDCTNDIYGCWVTSFGVVDQDWTTRTFPDNIPWDYAYYVINEETSTGHQGRGANGNLDSVVRTLGIDFDGATVGDATGAFGYSYSDDPNFMYCSEPLAVDSGTGDWWLGRCGLSGGASGGPWLDPIGSGNGTIVSVNSWGYTNQPGMAGPNLSSLGSSGKSASCVFAAAKTLNPTTEPRGVIPNDC